MTILEVQSISKSYGGLRVTDEVSLGLEAGELHAVIGPNGAGKTTLINLINGQVSPDSGCIKFGGRDITYHSISARALMGLVRSFQVSSVFLDFTVLQNVALAVQAQNGHSFEFWRDTRRDSYLNSQAMAVLARVNLADRAHDNAQTLAHGQRRQLEIAMVLATQPKVMLLDEPLAGMSAHEASDFVALIQSLKGHYSIILVEHDMDAVFKLADRVSVLVRGGVVASDSPEKIKENPEVHVAYLGEEENT